ncbi:nucleotidyltransferase [Cohnella sp. WQ 127256]|uniref:nucleotidyltransferase domain-containing protein n=1 Tax=Cohnella sp. WQ 127256 TaxID=2938790 RepID=UPI002117A9BC|nr:nucleotidyltransferase [Cohnella sp. WQ 127256]
MTQELQFKYNSLLEEVASGLDISPSKYKQAVDRYKKVSMWISAGEYEGLGGEIHCYAQGSFRLGTVVRPIRGGEESGYDIDLVCEFPIIEDGITPEALKILIGNRLAENKEYQEMLDEEGRRCWTLLYSEQDGIGFHLDILPAIPGDPDYVSVEVGFTQKAIKITHKNKDESYEWSQSNPSGYADWFEAINKPTLDLIKALHQKRIFENNKGLFARIDDVPEVLIKTPLQKVIQILKRHRDLRFMNQEFEDDKPISMIITTLAARLYQNEADVFVALNNIVDQLDNLALLLNPEFVLSKSLQDLELIKRNSDGTWIISNPVNPNENFADRWHENKSSKARAFFQWVKWVKEDLIQILNSNDINELSKSLKTSLGEQMVNKALKSLQLRAASLSTVVASVPPRIEISNPNKPWGFE